MICCVACLLLTAACRNEKSSDTTDTPESTLRQFVDFMNKGDYEGAKKLSTNAEYVNLIDQSYELDNSPIAQMEIRDIKCTEMQDSASCLCRFVFNGMEEEDAYPLVRRDGKWLVFTDDVIEQSQELEELDELPELPEETYDQIIENTSPGPGKE